MKILNLIILLLLTNSVLSQKKNKKNTYPHSTSAEQRLKGYNDRMNLNSKSILKNISFRNIGPTVMSGRVVDLDINPDDPSHFYVAYASGGLWETKNHGNSFVSLFDNQMVMTIGDIKVDWQNDIIYLGSGENNSSRSSYSGNGIYKSRQNKDPEKKTNRGPIKTQKVEKDMTQFQYNPSNDCGGGMKMKVVK